MQRIISHDKSQNAAYIPIQSSIYHHNKTTRHKAVAMRVCPGIFAVKANKLLASAT